VTERPGKGNPLDRLGKRHRLLRPTDEGYSAYTEDVVLVGHPDAVVRPRSEAEIQEILSFAHAHRIPVTAAGGQTSVTGSSVAGDGILLATEGMDRFLDVGRDPETGGMVAVAEPGIFLGDFQRRLEGEGWFYPPDPTSRDEACLGATVATNATGEDTLLYGPTRRWVRELRVVRADGSVLTLHRPPQSHPPEEKATAGYYAAVDPIDFLIGSEGTLGILTRISVDVIPHPGDVLAGLAFFPTLLSSLHFVVAARQAPELNPRALELIDRGSLDLVRENPEGISWPEETAAAILFKQEFRDPPERDRVLAAWAALLERSLTAGGAPHLLDAVLVLEGPTELQRLRSFRHRIPSVLGEVIDRWREQGGSKVGTDWWVPYPALPDFLVGWQRRIEEEGLTSVVFGHVGNGHPHLNFIPRDADERSRAHAMLLEMCRGAVDLGGGVAGEHGLGKLKRDLLSIQYSPSRIEEMRELKREWDPTWILGRGNLFAPEDAGNEA
jgi:FAD/FMN-containing dehydrogenase